MCCSHLLWSGGGRGAREGVALALAFGGGLGVEEGQLVEKLSKLTLQNLLCLRLGRKLSLHRG